MNDSINRNKLQPRLCYNWRKNGSENRYINMRFDEVRWSPCMHGPDITNVAVALGILCAILLGLLLTTAFFIVCFCVLKRNPSETYTKHVHLYRLLLQIAERQDSPQMPWSQIPFIVAPCTRLYHKDTIRFAPQLAPHPTLPPLPPSTATSITQAILRLVLISSILSAETPSLISQMTGFYHLLPALAIGPRAYLANQLWSVLTARGTSYT